MRRHTRKSSFIVEIVGFYTCEAGVLVQTLTLPTLVPLYKYLAYLYLVPVDMLITCELSQFLTKFMHRWHMVFTADNTLTNG